MDKPIENFYHKKLEYKAQYHRQLLIKILAHIIAMDLAEDKEMGFGGGTFKRSQEALLSDLNCHIAKVHFAQDEINDIKIIIEEAKKLI